VCPFINFGGIDGLSNDINAIGNQSSSRRRREARRFADRLDFCR